MTITFELYKTRTGTRIRAKHRNGNKLFNAGEAYQRRIDADTMLKNFIKAIQDGEFEIVDKAKKK